MLSLLGLTFLPSALEIDQGLEKFQNPYRALMRREGKIVGNRVVLVLLKIRTLGGKNSCTENSVTLTWVNRNCEKTLKTKVSLLFCLIIVLIWI